MRPSLILPIFVLTAAVSVAPALAQEAGTSSGSVISSGSQALGKAVSGNTIIVSEPARLSDSDTEMYRAWDQFAADHPDVARELGNRPSLLKSGSYVRRHPGLAKLFSDHPELRQAMIENPRDFVLHSHTRTKTAAG